MTKALWIVGGLAAVLSLACGGDDQSPKVTQNPDTLHSCIGLMVVSPGTATLHIGDTLRLSASASVGCSSMQTKWLWSSSNSAFAIVDSSGLVNAVSPGPVTIIASAVVDPNVKGAAAITVVP
jgi:Bacterial Ig-like domain (group 2)